MVHFPVLQFPDVHFQRFRENYMKPENKLEIIVSKAEQDETIVTTYRRR